MEKRIILAVTLSILVMFVYAIFTERFYPKKVEPVLEPALEVKERPIPIQEMGQEIEMAPPLKIEPTRGILENEHLRILVNNIGGSIEEVLLKDESFGSAFILKGAEFEKGLFFLNTDSIKEASFIDFKINRVNGEIVLSRLLDGLGIEKRFSLLDDRLGILAEISFKNLKDKTIDLQYKINLGTQFLDDKTHRGFFEIDIANPEKITRFPSYKLRNYKELYQKDLEWVATRDRFYSLIAKPKDVPVASIEILGDSFSNKVFLKTQVFTLMPDQEIKHIYLLYAGPNSLTALKRFGYGIEKSLSFGVFTSIAQILLTILNFFYKIFKNYGVSIIFLSLIINLFLFPLTLKSFKSIKELQAIQPQINKLREELKDNPQRLNKELMELYKRHKVNPFGGCIPMLLQMPIFFALYQTFMRSIELKSQGFLWIKDLSGPDAVFKLNFKLPIIGDSLNLLPILMVLAMFFQQRLSGAGIKEQTEQQRIMGIMMPVMFGFIFYNLPAGLVLYWLISTVFSSALQYVIIRHPIKKNEGDV